MTTYDYIARTAAGEQVAGAMRSDSEAAVLRTLDEQRLYPVRITMRQPRRRGIGAGRIRLGELGVMYGQLSDLLQAGVPMLRALQTLARAGLRRRLTDVIISVRDEVAAGKSLAEALLAHPKAFTPLDAAMVRAGERAGFLEDVLANLSEFLERQNELRSKVRGALVYPLVLTVIGTVLITGVLIVLVPRFRPFFGGISLPAPTMFLFWLSELLTEQLPLMVGLLVLAVIGLRVFLRSDAGRLVWDRCRLRVPVMGRVLRAVSITRFCRILGTMLANGVPIIQALGISKDATGSAVLTRSIEQATENVRAGESLAGPLRAGGLFPAEILEMIAVGEEANRLEKVLIRIAETVDRRTNRQVDAAVRLIEPLILLIMAVGIGFVAVGLLYPIFTMSQTIK